MKRILPALLASILFISPARVIADDPSSLFLGAYQEFQSGEAFERNGEVRNALDRYSSTQEVLEKIQKSNPDWQTMVVEYRLRKAKEGIERCRSTIEQLSLPVDTPKPAPLQKKGFEIDIPAPNISTRPSQSIAAKDSPVVNTASSTDLQLVRDVAEARTEINRLRAELETTKAQLSSSKMEVEKVKTEMVSAKSSLAQAEASLDIATKELETLRAKADLPPDEKVLKLSSRIADLESENAFLKDDRERLSGKLRRASDYIRETESNLAKVLDDRKKIAKERDQALSKVQKLKDNTDELASLRKENADLNKTLESTRADLESSFQKVKDELEQRLASHATELERMDELQRINGELAVRVENTEKVLQHALKEKSSRAQLELLNNELAETQQKLLAVRSLLEGDEQNTRLLVAQLDQTSSEVTRLGLDPNPSAEHQTLIEEGNVLRGIILSKIDQQNDRLKTVSELESKISEMQAKSNELTAELAEFSKPVEQVDASFAVVKNVGTENDQPPQSEVEQSVSKPTSAETSPKQTSAAVPNPSPQSSTPSKGVLPARRQDPVSPEIAKPAKDMALSLAEADQLLADGKALEAEKIFQSLVEADPENVALLTKFAVAQLALNRNTLSTATLKKALAIKPGDVAASLNLANAHTRLGNVVEAAKLLQGVIENDPQNAVAYNYLGIVYGKTRGKHMDAREAFTKSVELDKKFQNAHFNLAVSHARTSPTSLDMAKKHYEIAKKLGAAPDDGLEKLLKDIEPAR